MMDKLIQHLIKVCGAKFWCEVKVPSIGTADAVALIDDAYYIFEGKAKLSYALLAQCKRWQMLCCFCDAVVPYTPMENEETILAVNHFRSMDVGIVMVGDHVTHPSARNKNFDRRGIEAFLTDAHLYGGSFAKAGASSGKRASKANEEYLAIEKWVNENPDSTAKAAASAHGMKASKMLGLIKKKLVNVKTDNRGGVTYLTSL